MNITPQEGRGNWFHTYSNIEFYPLDPRPEEVRIEDIARSLSMMCRFAGHMNSFYSVAQHSVLVSENVPSEDAFWGLMHDASEAYIVDIPRPLKYSPVFAGYRELEEKVMNVICDRFGMSRTQPDSVKPIDNKLLLTEQRDLRNVRSKLWMEERVGFQPFEWTITPWSSEVAEKKFLERFNELYRGNTN